MERAKEKAAVFPFQAGDRRPAAARFWKVKRSLAISAVNALGRLLGPGVHARLDAQQLLKAARRRTGLEDFGAPPLEEPLYRLAASAASEARLNLIGSLSTRQDLLRLLINRLRLEADRKRNPAISDVEIRRPLIITGLPRTGTTLLHGLLALDPSNRVLRTWEALYPSPPPTAATYETDRRIRRVEQQLRWFHRILKNFDRIHPVGARLPEECLILFSHSFLSYQFETTHYLPSYLDWLRGQDLRPAYAVHRRILQHLQHRCAKDRWVLKAPAHLFDLGALFAVYPDACVVMTHRDPLEVSASGASLTATLRSAFSSAVDPLELGPECSRRWAEAVTRAIAYRDGGRVAADRFVDVYYTDLMADPVATLKNIYTGFDLNFPRNLEDRIRAFMIRNPRDRFGRHRYALEDFGLTAGGETIRYAAYRRRFGL